MADAVIPANKIVPVFAAMTGADVAVWTPASGKRIRFQGFYLMSTTVTGTISVKNGPGGTGIMFIPNPTNSLAMVSMGLGNGSVLDVNATLVFNAANTMGLTGYLYGCEE